MIGHITIVGAILFWAGIVIASVCSKPKLAALFVAGMIVCGALAMLAAGGVLS